MNSARVSPVSAVMTGTPEPRRIAGFRTRLLATMMLVVSVVVGLALSVMERNLAANVEQERRREFQAELAALHHRQEIRHAALVERCRALARKPRIHAALEDNALDLLYPSAQDELRDVMASGETPAGEEAGPSLHATFYRFLDARGAVISPPATAEVGALTPEEEAHLALGVLPNRQQLGYLPRGGDDAAGSLAEVLAVPIHSSESGEVIAALVLGSKPAELGGGRPDSGIMSGVWVGGRLVFPALTPAARESLTSEVGAALAAATDASQPRRVAIAGQPYLLFAQRLNPGSLFPPAYEVCVYPLAELVARQRQLRWQAVFAGGGLLLIGLVVSQLAARRLAAPVERLAAESEEDRVQRARAEAALELSHEELQRSARFSADASHQLKTPVTVLRAGLEELLTQDDLSPATREEIGALVHQTFRLSSVIEDLLLLSRVDAGRLTIDLQAVDLSQLIEAALDDLSVLPEVPGLKIETEFPESLQVAGEKRYTALIVQNLLENAHKYNRPDGRLRIGVVVADGEARLMVGNTGRPIPTEAQRHIFERFHRGAMGENVPGYGLGLNLARELARLHRGDLRLVKSSDDWTEFEVRFRLMPPPAATAS